MFHLEVAPDLELFLLTEAHCSPLFDLIDQNRAYLRAWLPWVDGTQTLADVRRLIRFGLRQHAHSNGLNAGIWYQSRLVGVISFNYIDHVRQQTEIGYWLSEAHQGNGIVTAACQAITDYAFDRLGLQRVEIHCASANLKSRAIPERLGFAVQRVTPEFAWTANRFVETIIYSMSATAWQERKAIHECENRHRGQL